MKKPLLMGILNITPDSFYDGGKYSFVDDAVAQAVKMLKDGANIIDIGAESTRPGSKPVSLEDEMKRIKPVLHEMKRLSVPFSIDTYKPSIAKIAIDHGCCMVNDVTGLTSKAMRDLVKGANVSACVMHKKQHLSEQHTHPTYPKGIVFEILKYFREKLLLFKKEKFNEKNIIFDPGIGFGKTVNDNILIVQNIAELKKIGPQVLVGLSRKSFMGRILHKKPIDLLPATITMNTIALMGGADIIRVHDVLEHRDLIDVFSYQRLIKS